MAESCSFTPPPTCTDTIIKLFFEPMHLDNIIPLPKKKKKKQNKKEIFNYIGDGAQVRGTGVLTLDADTTGVIKKARDNISLPPRIGKEATCTTPLGALLSILRRWGAHP